MTIKRKNRIPKATTARRIWHKETDSEKVVTEERR
jgi:hypothetical protein